MMSFLRDIGSALVDALKWMSIVAGGIAMHGLIYSAAEKHFDQHRKPAVKQQRSVAI